MSTRLLVYGLWFRVYGLGFMVPRAETINHKPETINQKAFFVLPHSDLWYKWLAIF